MKVIRWHWHRFTVCLPAETGRHILTAAAALFPFVVDSVGLIIQKYFLSTIFIHIVLSTKMEKCMPLFILNVH